MHIIHEAINKPQVTAVSVDQSAKATTSEHLPRNLLWATLSKTAPKPPVEDFYNNPSVGLIQLKGGVFSAAPVPESDADQPRKE